MNAPAQIRIPNDERTGPKLRLEETRDERAHRASITTHLPNESEMAMAARCEIAAMRDRASMGLSRASVEVVPILTAVTQLATQAVYAPMETKRLFLLRCALRDTMEAARALERVVVDGGR